MRKWVRRPGTESVRTLNHVLVQRVSKTPLLGIPCIEDSYQHSGPSISSKSAAYIFHDHIVGGDAISRNEEQSLVVDFVEVAHLAPSDERQGTLQVSVCKSLSHGEIVQWGGK